jgi:hypothetical protein
MDASSTAVLTTLSCPAPPLPVFGPLGAENIPTTSQTASNPTATGIFPDIVSQTDSPANQCGTVATAPTALAKKSGKMRPGTTNTARCDCGYQSAMIFRVFSLFSLPGVYVHRIGVRKIQEEPLPSSRSTLIICPPMF